MLDLRLGGMPVWVVQQGGSVECFARKLVCELKILSLTGMLDCLLVTDAGLSL